MSREEREMGRERVRFMMEKERDNEGLIALKFCIAQFRWIF